METHRDSEHRREWLRSLKEKARENREAGLVTITGGAADEEVLAAWQSHGVDVRQRPPDEHGILRISVGGGDDTPVKLNYCVFRGDHSKCVDLSLQEECIRRARETCGNDEHFEGLKGAIERMAGQWEDVDPSELYEGETVKPVRDL